MLQEVGHKFCETILDFCDPDQIKVKQVLEELEIMLPKASDSESDEDGDDEGSGDDNAPNSDNDGNAATGGEVSKPTKRKAKGKK